MNYEVKGISRQVYTFLPWPIKIFCSCLVFGTNEFSCLTGASAGSSTKPCHEKRPTLDEGRETRDLLERLEKSLEAYRKTRGEVR